MEDGFGIECPRINFSSLDHEGFERFQENILFPVLSPSSADRAAHSGTVKGRAQFLCPPAATPAAL
jgi:hypothetical protein